MDKQYKLLCWMLITLVTVVQLFAPVSQILAQNIHQPISAHEHIHMTQSSMHHNTDMHNADTDTSPHCVSTLCASVCASHCMSATTSNSIKLVDNIAQNQFERAPSYKHEPNANQPNTPPPKFS